MAGGVGIPSFLGDSPLAWVASVATIAGFVLFFLLLTLPGIPVVMLWDWIFG